MSGYHLTDATNVNWPHALPWRGESSKRGYKTPEAAQRRAYRIAVHHNATQGSGGPDLRVVER